MKQIVGATLSDSSASALRTNFTSDLSPAHYAALYRTHALDGGHIIKLGPGNEEAAKSAVQAWPDGMHVGGGINESNAKQWIEAGAQKVSLQERLVSWYELN